MENRTAAGDVGGGVRRTPRPRTDRSRRAALAAAVLTAAAGGLLGPGAPVAPAADACPNAAVRAQQNATHLPNCMAYEKITPANKDGEAPGVMQVTGDGSGLTFALNSGIEDSQSFVNARFRSTRRPDGRWTTTALQPAMRGPELPTLGSGIAGPLAVTPDLSRVVIGTPYALDPNDQGIVNPVTSFGSPDVFIREADGTYRRLAPDLSVPDTSTLAVSYATASSDLERVVVGTRRQWDPRVTDENVNHLYLWTPSGTHLVSVLPNGDLATDLPDENPQFKTVEGPEASADGRRIMFIDGRISGDPRVYVRFDPDDPATAATREVAVGPNGERCISADNATLSADGSKVLFSCYDTPQPGTLAGGTYLRDLDGGADAVRRVGDATYVLAATPDFSRVYATTGQTSTGSLLLMRDAGDFETIATSTSGTGFGQDASAAASTDGEYLTFSTDSDLGLPGVDHGTLTGEQVYRYAARTDELTCVSCRRDGLPTEGVGSLDVADVGGGSGGGGAAYSGARPVSTRGTVAFSSVTALVPEDTNGLADAYAWVDGRAVLLSSGQGAQTSVAQGGSADGSSFIVRTTDALVSDDRDGGQYDLYAVRENGGVLVAAPPAPCRSNCQGPAPERPAPPVVGTAEASGGGNVTTAPRTPTPRTTATLSGAKSVRGSRTTVQVKVSRAGSIRLSGPGVRTATVQAKKAGTYRVTVRLSASGLKQQRRKGRLAVRVTARFSPETGVPVRAQRSITFTVAKKKGGR